MLKDEMTAQEVFDTVATHLLTQNKASIGKLQNKCGTICMYRNDHGLKCAAGCLISDDEYSISLEGKTVNKDGGLGFPNRVKNNLKLVCDLQIVHDNFSSDKWPGKLREVASQNKLDPGVIDGFTAKTV